MTACGLNEEENITPSIDEMVVAPAATDSPSPSQLRRKGRSKMSLHQRRNCHGRYDEIGSFCVYIENFSTNNDYIVVRPVEWIIPEDEKRIKELDLDVERDLASEKERVEAINRSNQYLRLIDEAVDLMRGIIRRASDIIGYSIIVIYHRRNQRTLMKFWISWNHIFRNMPGFIEPHIFGGVNRLLGL